MKCLYSILVYTAIINGSKKTNPKRNKFLKTCKYFLQTEHIHSDSTTIVLYSKLSFSTSNNMSGRLSNSYDLTGYKFTELSVGLLPDY